jgi:N4-gp56 family major capsid protein
MGATTFAYDDALTQHKWADSLAVEAAVAQYMFKFMGEGFDNMVRVLKDLTKTKGDKITYGLRMKLAGDGTEGDTQIEGTLAEEPLSFYSDYVYVDQRRKGTKVGGKMSEQRVAYNLRKESRDALVTWWAEDLDQQMFIYAAGIRGIDTALHFGLSWTGRASNTLTDCDTSHLLFAGDATSAGAIDEADIMDLVAIEKCISKAETSDPMIQPFNVGGENKHIMLMHTWQQHQMRVNTSTGDWQDITKFAGERGKGNKLYQNALGEYANVILHKHRYIPRQETYGDSDNLPGARALFLGAQALTVAWAGTGAPSGVGGAGRFGWNEETDDRGNQIAITTNSIYGIKATIFNSKRFGMFGFDTYCKDPNS